jgi:hypothetical protein
MSCGDFCRKQLPASERAPEASRFAKVSRFAAATQSRLSEETSHPDRRVENDQCRPSAIQRLISSWVGLISNSAAAWFKRAIGLGFENADLLHGIKSSLTG